MKAKAVSFLLVFGMAHAVAFGRDTAYQALRTLGNEKGQDILNQVVEVHGKDGDPQPGTWRILVSDAQARGGVREFEISKRKVVSERTPVMAYDGGGSPMNFQNLNLDSEGAFSIANQEAGALGVGFDRIDYLLRSDSGRATPVWVLRLIDASGNAVGVVQVAANDGKIVSRERLNGRQDYRESDRAALEGRTYVQEDYRQNDYRESSGDSDEDEDRRRIEEDQEDDSLSGKMGRFGNKLERNFSKFGRKVKGFFSGD